MNIFEMLEKRALNPNDEFYRLAKIFNEKHWFNFKRATCSLKDIFNETFYKCNCRSTFLSVDDLFKSLRIEENNPFNISWKKLFTYCEILRNVCNNSFYYDIEVVEFEKYSCMLKKNMDEILTKTNHEWAQIKEGYIIVDKNPATTEAIECLEDNKADLALNMIEYNRVLLKGNLTRKREILVALADYTEPMNNDFKGTQYAALYSDSRFLVNAIDIRHNNSGKGDLPEKAKSWTSQEKEAWYDKTYQVLLTVILARKHIDVSKEIQDLKPARN